MIEIINGNALHIPLADESVQCAITSPPYWGLRAYGTQPQVFGGDMGCAHEWGNSVKRKALTGGVNDYSQGKHFYGDGDGASYVPETQSDFCIHCHAWRGELGLEPTPELFIEHMVLVFREVRRVLRPDGTLWLNMGDCYATSANGRSAEETKEIGKDDRTFRNKPFSTVSKSKRIDRGSGRWGGGNNPAGGDLKPKDLVGMPWALAFALRADGWWLRSEIIWDKVNPMPESVRDRPTKSHEQVFLLTKSADYFYDVEAIKEPGKEWTGQAATFKRENGKATELKAPGQSRPSHRPDRKQDAHGKRTYTGFNDRHEDLPTRNRRTVWHIPTQPYSGSHFATFPEKLVEPCILAGTSERGCCPACGRPWERVTETDSIPTRIPKSNKFLKSNGHGRKDTDVIRERRIAQVETLGWSPACACRDLVPCEGDHTHGDDCLMCDNTGQMPIIPEPVPCVVFDPFCGTATVGKVAVKHRRRFVGLELNPAYIELARGRTSQVQIAML